MPGQWPHTTQYNRMMGLSSPLLESVITIVNMPNECKPAVVSFLSRFRQICSLFLTDRTQTIFFSPALHKICWVQHVCCYLYKWIQFKIGFKSARCDRINFNNSKKLNKIYNKKVDFVARILHWDERVIEQRDCIPVEICLILLCLSRSTIVYSKWCHQMTKKFHIDPRENINASIKMEMKGVVKIIELVQTI